MTETIIDAIARATLRAHALREASYVKGTFRYGLGHDEASEAASTELGITDPRARTLVRFFHNASEGIDLCHGLLAQAEAQAA
jgi:hypothetical protein